MRYFIVHVRFSVVYVRFSIVYVRFSIVQVRYIFAIQTLLCRSQSFNDQFWVRLQFVFTEISDEYRRISKNLYPSAFAIVRFHLSVKVGHGL